MPSGLREIEVANPQNINSRSGGNGLRVRYPARRFNHGHDRGIFIGHRKVTHWVGHKKIRVRRSQAYAPPRHGRVLNGIHDFPRLLAGLHISDHDSQRPGIHRPRQEMIQALGNTHEWRNR